MESPEAVMLEMGDDLVFRYKRNATEAEQRARNRGRNQKITREQVYDLVSRRGWVTAKELAQEQPVVSEQTFKRHLEDLYNAGELERRERSTRGRPIEYSSLPVEV